MRIRIYNANILTMQPGQRMFCGEVHIQDDKIVYLGTGRWRTIFTVGSSDQCRWKCCNARI